MSYNLILNSSNVVGIYNSQFQYKFIQGSFTIYPDSEICISQAVIPYSFFNILNSFYNNAVFSYNWYYSNGLYQTYVVAIPDGFYSTNDINNILEQYMISQNQYFQNTTTGNNMYFISIQTNTTYYTNQIICSSIPSSVPSGYTAPVAGFNYNNGRNYGFPTSGYNYTPQVIISNNNFGSIIGYKTGTYPNTATQTNYSGLGNITPNATPINSLILLSNLVKNDCSTPPNILDSMSINCSFGNNIVYQPSYEKWVRVHSGTYNSMTFQLVDQNFRAVPANDPNMMISLLLRQGNKPVEKLFVKSSPIVNPIKPLLLNDEEEEKNI